MTRFPIALVAVLLAAAVHAPENVAARATLDPFLDALPPGTLADAFVVFEPGHDGSARTTLARAGLTVGAELPAADAVHTWGPVERLRALRAAPQVRSIEHAGTLQTDLNRATWVSRARAVREGTRGLNLAIKARDGSSIDGRGVGIAVVDSGVDATHPDLLWAGFGLPGAVTAINLKLACAGTHMLGTQPQVIPACIGPMTATDVPNSDTTSGHGTHIAGIAAGRGTISDGRVVGVAPGASLYAFGAGEGARIYAATAAAAFQWIYDHGATADPPIRVVNASLSTAGAHDPDAVLTRLTRALVLERGMTMIWSAGNTGGNGSDDDTSAYAKDPTPGVLSVADYDDNGLGTRDHRVAVTSSRGQADDPATWPDLAAPGTAIRSTCTAVYIQCIYKPPSYGPDSGTSMAASHVAGIAAMLYQVAPTLTPADVEQVLERTAYHFTAGAAYEPDPTNPDSDSSFDKGHGLVDARAAVIDVLGLPGDIGVGPGWGSNARGVWFTDPVGDEPNPAKDIVGGGITERSDGSIVLTWQVRDGTIPPPDGAQYVMRGVSGSVVFDVVVAYGDVAYPLVSTPAPQQTWRDGDAFHALFDPATFGAARGELLTITNAASYWPIADFAPALTTADAFVDEPYIPRYVYGGPAS